MTSTRFILEDHQIRISSDRRAILISIWASGERTSSIFFKSGGVKSTVTLRCFIFSPFNRFKCGCRERSPGAGVRVEHPPALAPSPPPTEVVAVHHWQCLMVKKVGKGQILVHPQGGEFLIRLPVELQLIELKPYGSKNPIWQHFGIPTWEGIRRMVLGAVRVDSV